MDHSHGNMDLESLREIQAKRKLVSKDPIVIHDYVWIGVSVSILSGVTINENTIIGASSVASGVPAKIIKTLPMYSELVL